MVDTVHPVGLPAAFLLVDYLVGNKPSDVAQHLIARRAFLHAFLDDEKVCQLFENWLMRTDLKSLRDHLKSQVDLEKPGSMRDLYTSFATCDPDLWRLPLLLHSSGHDRIYGGPFERALKTLGEWPVQLKILGETKNWPDFGAEAVEFLTDLDVPYPWLLLGLLREFLGRFVLFEQMDESRPVTVTPFGDVHWIWPGWKGRGATRPAPPSFVAPRRIPDVSPSKRDTLERRALWFYRATVRKHSIRSIAQSEFGDEFGDRRRDIQIGIPVVKRLFRLRLPCDGELMTPGALVLAMDRTFRC